MEHRDMDSKWRRASIHFSSGRISSLPLSELSLPPASRPVCAGGRYTWHRRTFSRPPSPPRAAVRACRARRSAQTTACPHSGAGEGGSIVGEWLSSACGGHRSCSEHA